MEAQQKDGKDGPYEVRTGSGLIFGKEVWINAYEKTTKTGKTLLSIVFKEKQQKTGPMSQTDIVPKQAPSVEETPLSDIPF